MFATNCGSFTITLDQAQSPATSASLVSLARAGFFDNTVFHRIVPGFVIQGGDPTQSGTGGPGYKTTDTPPAGARYVKGVVAMAKTQAESAGTSGSQFFVVTGADIGLPPDYAIVGKVTSGLAVVERIGKLGDPATELPTQPVVTRKGRGRRTTVKDVGAIVLAAGEASRFGTPKQRLLLPEVLERLGQSPVGEVVVVAGAHTLETPARVVTCPGWKRGPGVSLRCGLDALGPAARGGDRRPRRRTRSRAGGSHSCDRRLARTRRRRSRSVLRRQSWASAAACAPRLGRHSR